jgi:hypothetical protein
MRRENPAPPTGAAPPPGATQRAGATEDVTRLQRTTEVVIAQYIQDLTRAA